MRGRRWTVATGAWLLGATLLVGAAGSAGAALWCGENGVVSLSFAADVIESVAHLKSGPDGTTTVDLYAFLTDVAPVQRDGEALLAIGGIELTLAMAGAEGTIIAEAFPYKQLNVGRRPGEIALGIDPSLRLAADGRTLLVHWQILFTGEVRDVRFHLDPSHLISCARTEGCAESGTQALYIGAYTSGQVADTFGAGQAPAVLNPTGEPDLALIRGQVSWQDVGAYQARH